MFLDQWKLNYQGTPSPLLFVFSDLLCACLNIEGKEVGDICHLYINTRENRKGNQRGQSRETGNIAYTRQRRGKKTKKRNTTQYVLDTAIRKQSQAKKTLIRHVNSKIV